MITITGKSGIKVTVLADSISQAGVRMITFEWEYPRLILAELNTHRALSKNSFSSRAVPFEKMLKSLNGIPVRFGEANPGMQDKGEAYNAPITLPIYSELVDGGYVPGVYVEDEEVFDSIEAWEYARDSAIKIAKAFYEAGYHKQVYNRLLEPFQMMKTIISGTEWGNFYWLRDDGSADPTLAELARCAKEAAALSKPELLKAGEWHLPYVDVSVVAGVRYYSISGNNTDNTGGWVQSISLEQAIKISCARCAAVSYRNENYGLEKSLELYDRLVGSEKKHASALEHCATPIAPTVFEWSDKLRNVPFMPDSWEKGISHIDRNSNFWSGNLRGWIQHRKTVDGENYEA